MMLSPVDAADSSAEAESTGFYIAPVHWDKNIAVVDVCSAAEPGANDVVLWPETTGGLLRLMDALKYEYEMRYFQCVVFVLAAEADAVAVKKTLKALIECVTVCDLLRIPLHISIRRGDEKVEVFPTYANQDSSCLILEADGGLSFYSATATLPFTAQAVAELEPSLASAAEQGTAVILYWTPEVASYARFIELIELCNKLDIGYTLMIQP